MAITIKTNEIKLKTQNGEYQSSVTFADQSTASHIAEVNAAITEKGEEVLDSIPSDYTELTADVSDLKSAIDGTGLQSYVKIAEYPILPFEIGAIQITNNGWDYQENDKRIRTPRGQEIWLNAGDIIALTDYTNARFYLGVRRADGTYTTASWKSVDFTVTIPGWYVMLVGRRTSETVLTNVAELAALVRITRIKTTQDNVDDMQNALGYVQYAFDAYPIHGINHRGLQKEAPENTLPAFRLSVSAGYKFVETDIQFTSDDIPVLLHDTTLNRTARNADGSELATTVNIADITYAQALEYVFPLVDGVYDASFLTNKIMSFEEFIVFCKRTEIFPYLELKSEATYTQAQVNILIDILTKYNMLRNVSWISWSDDWLRMIVNADKGARIGRIKNSEITGTAATTLNTFKTGYNRVFWSITPYANDDWTITEASLTRAKANNQAISIGVISTQAGMLNVLTHFEQSGYISGCLSNGRVNFADITKGIAMGTIEP